MPRGTRRDLWNYQIRRPIAPIAISTLQGLPEPVLIVGRFGKSPGLLDMGVDLEVDKLTTNLVDQVDKLTKKVAEVNEKLSGAFKETHDTIGIVDNQVEKLNTVNSKLKAIVGGQTNDPPPGDLPA